MSVKPVKHVSVSNHDIMVTTTNTNTNTTIIIITLINIFHTNWYIQGKSLALVFVTINTPLFYKVKVSKR